MAPNGVKLSSEESIAAALQELGQIEKDFAAVELDALRQKEYTLRELYSKRQTSIDKIPNFWATVLANGPDELQDVFNSNDAPFLEALKSMTVERPEIKSDTEGEPRSLKFTFFFDKNDLFEDKVVIKIFEFQAGEDGGALVSVPINFKWTKKAKKEGVNTLLDLAEELFKAENAFVGGPIDANERETLWQCQKLRDALAEVTEQGDSPGFLNWFGYRGVAAAAAVQAEQDPSETGSSDDVEDLEIFPEGDDIAMILAEELWPNVMDYFVRAQEESDDEIDDLEEESDDEEDAPALVEVEPSKQGQNGDDNDEEEENAKQPPKKKTKHS